MSSTRPQWGNAVIVGTVAGHPCRLYETRPKSVSALIDDAGRFGDRSYLVQGDRRVTFTGFVAAARRAASLFEDLGVRRGDRVLLWGSNSIDWVIGYWATIAAGGVVVPGNAWWSDDEVEHVIEAVTPALIVVDEPRRDRLHDSAPTALFDDIRNCAQSEDQGAISPSEQPEEGDVAIILYTSGTTGAPKGVTLSHRAVIATLQNLLVSSGRVRHLEDLTRHGPVSLLTLPLFHMGGMQTLMTAAIAGGTVVLQEGRFDPDAVVRTIEAERVTVWGCVPTMLTRVLSCPGLADADVSSVRSLAVGGGPVSPGLLARAQEAFPHARRGVGSSYGMSETGGLVANGSGDEIARRPHCAGRALPVAEIRIKDPDENGVGEILARTPTVMDGYWGVADDPILDTDGWIHSGDIGRLDDAGYLYVLDRSKDMVIRGGENIASVHVESRLMTHPAVAEAAVVGLPHPDLGEEVGAVIVPHPSAVVSVSELREHAAHDLAHFEVPSRWWIRENPLPLSPVGKVLKRVLRDEWITSWPGSDTRSSLEGS
jgi:long-chain acyl-CoA synthetase